ncbi:TetR/AcrR family transcriptional regulator [Micromonosporaceae bacterium Da 78-11]
MTAFSEAEAPRATRRRGADLNRAIYRTALDELAETSFEELSFDRIATRAQTGKAALYRRWSTPAELILDALTDPVSGFPQTAEPATGALRTDLIFLLTDFARALQEPHGRAMRPLMTQRVRHPELYERVRELIIMPRHTMLIRLLSEAAERGEVRPDAAIDRIAGVGPRLVVGASMDVGPVTDAEIEAIVDEILLPLIRPAPPVVQHAGGGPG